MASAPPDSALRLSALPLIGTAAKGSRSSRIEDEVVTLFVSSGMPLVAVPDVKGYTRADAEHALAEAKLRAKIVPRFDKAPKDTVLDVKPAGGAQAPENSAVTLVVSQGEAPVKVPQLVGLSLDAARALLTKNGLTLNVDQQTPSDMIPANTVASQAVGADTSLARAHRIERDDFALGGHALRQPLRHLGELVFVPRTIPLGIHDDVPACVTRPNDDPRR